jgi:hypothetical protein
MNKPLIIIIIVCGIFLVIVAGVSFFAIENGKQSSVVIPPPTSFPVSGNTKSSTPGTSTGLIVLTEQNKSTIAVKDFVHNGVTIPDPTQPSQYVLAGNSGVCLPNGTCPGGASTTDFYITYDPADQTFNVLLRAEPLGEVRDEAEQFLQSTLGVTTTQLCNLNITVGTILSVNSNYAGEELRFKDCPNAVPLP